MLISTKKSKFEQGIFFKKVYAEVKKIPYGQVSSYGAIAQQIGFKRYARHVGYALNAVQEKDRVPWHRVVNAQGEISIQKNEDIRSLQKKLLEQEGIDFDAVTGKINLNIYHWRP